MVHLQPPTPQIYPQLNFRGGKMPCDSISIHMVVCSCFHRAPGSPLPQTVGINPQYLGHEFGCTREGGRE